MGGMEEVGDLYSLPCCLMDSPGSLLADTRRASHAANLDKKLSLSLKTSDGSNPRFSPIRISYSNIKCTLESHCESES
jgi:hypothetical protein